MLACGCTLLAVSRRDWCITGRHLARVLDPLSGRLVLTVLARGLIAFLFPLFASIDLLELLRVTVD